MKIASVRTEGNKTIGHANAEAEVEAENELDIFPLEEEGNRTRRQKRAADDKRCRTDFTAIVTICRQGNDEEEWNNYSRKENSLWSSRGKKYKCGNLFAT